MTPSTSPQPEERDGHPKIGTDAYFAWRAKGWNERANEIVALLRNYEDCHPSDATCLAPLLQEIDNVVPRGEGWRPE